MCTNINYYLQSYSWELQYIKDSKMESDKLKSEQSKWEKKHTVCPYDAAHETTYRHSKGMNNIQGQQQKASIILL